MNDKEIEEKHQLIEDIEPYLPSLEETEKLAVLMEECAEVQQVIGKILRHGYDSYHPETKITNREDLAREIVDVFTAIILIHPEVKDIIEEKFNSKEYREYLVEKKNRYLHFSKLNKEDLV